MFRHFSAIFSGHNEDIIHSTKQWERRCQIAICKLVQDQNQYFTSEWTGEMSVSFNCFELSIDNCLSIPAAKCTRPEMHYTQGNIGLESGTYLKSTNITSLVKTLTWRGYQTQLNQKFFNTKWKNFGNCFQILSPQFAKCTLCGLELARGNSNANSF
jgi:hypothetical protein